MTQCMVCGKELDGEKYGCVWTLTDDGLMVGFVCLPCGDRPEFIDVTEEVTG